MDGWALGSVEPGDPRWAPVGDHAVDGQASCLHRHRDDMGWPMATALSTRSLPHYGSTFATTRTCKRPKTSLSPWWWYTLPTGLITPCVAPTLVAQIQLGTPHGWPVGQHCTNYPTTKWRARQGYCGMCESRGDEKTGCCFDGNHSWQQAG